MIPTTGAQQPRHRERVSGYALFPARYRTGFLATWSTVTPSCCTDAIQGDTGEYREYTSAVNEHSADDTRGDAVDSSLLRQQRTDRLRAFTIRRPLASVRSKRFGCAVGSVYRETRARFPVSRNQLEISAFPNPQSRSVDTEDTRSEATVMERDGTAHTKRPVEEARRFEGEEIIER
uniref:Uncharacterized protein n=1 Tax=Peronospora matthiolae TaxID=2874970 RepID=A0AAV1U6S3_9STRA